MAKYPTSGGRYVRKGNSLKKVAETKPGDGAAPPEPSKPETVSGQSEADDKKGN